ncbi:LysR substrate-binding domain-containing protein [Paracandidimonas soli]|uniref:LysR substrate-binding domain-containing protein n=1 Tax=Paracandidimonas soli TaxID=1917182 RepID=UPI00333F5A48
MRNGIPNLGALQAFEATARLGTFSRAAEELSLTHSAVYRQVAGLEHSLGVQLFNRVRRRVVLTPQGAEYAARVRHHLEQLEKDTFGLRTRSGLGRSLHIAVLPTQATTWLIPRMPDFQRRHPDITISLSARTLPFQFNDHPYDAAIYHSEQPWPRTRSVRLFAEGELLPVCRPDLLQDSRGAGGMQGLTHLHMMSRPDAWRAWYRQHGLEFSPLISAGPQYELFSMTLAAVRAGMGVALAPRFLVADAIVRGELALAGPGGLTVAESYFFGYPLTDEEGSDALQVFEQWLIRIARAESA